jgi:signal transduction histidine kinase/ligand-binding sensor domain-containing protein
MAFKFLFNIFFILELSLTALSGQEIKFEYLTADNGLSQNSISCILQDKRGFMWFGTSNGLNRFDGCSFINYYANVKDSCSIAGNAIGTVYEDREGNIWIGTDNGMSLYNRDHDNFINFRHQDNDSNSLSGLIISCFCEDSKLRLWVGSVGGGLNLFDRAGKKFKHFRHNDTDPNSLSSNAVHVLIEDTKGRIWVGSEGGGLSLFNEEGLNFINFKHDDANPASFSSNNVFSFGMDNSGNLWAGTLENGICQINLNPEGTYTFSSYKPNTKDFRRFKILSICSDMSDGLWIGTENGGLDFFDLKNRVFRNYHVEKDIPGSLNNNSIHAIYKDKTGNLWVGTYTGGVNVVKKNMKNIKTYRNIPGNDNSLSNDATVCFFEDTDGSLWIGTDGGGVTHWDRKTNTMNSFTTKNSGLKSDAVMAICKDGDNDIWMGGWGCGLNLYNRKNHSLTTFSHENNGLPNNNIRDLMVDNKGQIWVSFGGIGFALFDKQHLSFKVYTPENSRLPSQWIICIRKDFYGNLLIGHQRGFTIFNPKNGSFENFSQNEDDGNALSENQVNTILVAQDSTIWLGTINGLNWFNPAIRKFTAFYIQEGLPNNYIEGLAEDKHGHIWISTAGGVSDFNPVTKKFKNYNLSDGLQGKNFTRNSCFTSSKGEILFGGPNGFNIIQPDSLFDNPNIPPIVITGLTIFNKPVKVGEPGSPLLLDISQSDKIVLSYRQSVFSLEFVALDYTAPTQNQYAYYLEGFEHDWNYIGTKHSATYTNLDPGNYVFHVKGSNNDGKWDEKGVSLQISITPPYWKTWWFKLIVLIFIVILIRSYVGMRTYLISKNNVRLEAQVKERTKELDLKNELLVQQTNDLNETNVLIEERQQQIEEQAEELMTQKDELERINSELQEINVTKDKFFSIIAHDIKNPFLTILGYSELLQNNFSRWSEDKKIQIVNLLDTTSKNIYELLENLLQWSTSQRGAIEFIPEKYRLTEEINYVIMLFKNSADEKEIKIVFDVTDENIFVHVDVRMLHTILRNLINNAVKFTNRGGLVEVVAGVDCKFAFIKVIDNGVGISAENLDKLFRIDSHHNSEGTNKEKGTGLGLILSKEFVEKHGGKIWVESEEGVGSTFNFTLPLFTLE